MTNVAANIIQKCGGHQKVADWCGVSLQTVYRWTWSKDKGGPDGLIPSRYQSHILDCARDDGVSLSPADFFTSAVSHTDKGAA